MKLTLNSQLMDGWQITWGLDAEHERFTSNQMFFDLAQAVLTPESWTVKHEAYRSDSDIQLESDLLISG